MNYSNAGGIKLHNKAMAIGCLAAVFSAMCFSGMVFIINDVKDTYSAIEITFFRTLSLVVLIFPCLKLKHIDTF